MMVDSGKLNCSLKKMTPKLPNVDGTLGLTESVNSKYWVVNVAAPTPVTTPSVEMVSKPKTLPTGTVMVVLIVVSIGF